MPPRFIAWIVLIMMTIAICVFLVLNPPALPQKKPVLGGAFSLMNQNGVMVTDTTYHGQYTLVFFGFTRCPEICPTALATITRAMDMLPSSKQAQITPIFITVDGDNDTPLVIKEYLSHFHPRFVGLTGTTEQLDRVYKAYKVYHGATLDAGIDHSSYVYFMDKRGNFVQFFVGEDTPQDIANVLKKVL
jgi:cytochrome oxidase Cu insertion factor (SCO1/SenC/PrrC family)